MSLQYPNDLLSREGIDEARFAEAYRRVALEERISEGFSVYAESTVHKTVKLYLEPRAEMHERPLLGGVADIFSESGVTEVQTGAFAPLLPKLKRFLPHHKVNIVHPFAIHTAHRWLDRESGEISTPTRVGTARSILSSGRQIYGIRELIGHENLTVTLLGVDVEEFRALDGWDRTRKRGATLLGKIPVRLLGTLLLRSRSDYSVFLPDSLPDTFGAAEYLCAIKSRSRYDRINLKLLEYLGIIRTLGKSGRAVVYSRV